jgi:hypothetical protein
MWHVWGTAEVHTVFWWGDPREGDHLKDLRVDGKIILKSISLSHDRDRWWALVNAVMNLRVPRPVNISGRTLLHAVSYLLS